MYNIIITTQLLNYVSSSYRYSVYAEVASIVFFITNYAKKINNNNVASFFKKRHPTPTPIKHTSNSKVIIIIIMG